MHILIAEDSPTQAEKLKYVLEAAGHRVTVAPNGRAALEAARAAPHDLLISDVMMPEMDGYALCKALKSDERLRRMPVILLTSLSSSADVIRGLESGADNFIRKPYDDKYLLSRLDHVIKRQRPGGPVAQQGVEIQVGGQTYLITSDREQILDLLVSTYEEAVYMNEQLKAVNKELEAFSYSVSHDLRAPLRHIDGFSQALEQDCADRLPPAGTEHLRRIRAAVKRMEELIEDLLELSRVTRGDLKHERIDLSLLANKVLEGLRRAQPERAVKIVVTPGLVAEGDQRLIQVVLENLLGNAWKYTQKCAAPVIEFGMADQDGTRTYYVKDNGAGFDMAFAGKLFAPFQRLHAAEEFPGSGIGLATVQRIIHRHGGRVWAEGAVGKGATVSFTLG